MFVKYEHSNAMSQHLPFRVNHDTVLRMEGGVSEAKCVYSGVSEVDCVWRVG